MSSRFNVGWVTDVGRVRDHNEDAALIIAAAHDGDGGPPSFGLFVLADGMGGHRAGEVASSLAARVAAHHITRESYLSSLLDRERDANQPALTEVLIAAAQAANRTVSREVPGGGTTLICALVLGAQAYVAHVGDSRAYVLTETGLEQITHDHSVVDRLLNSGRLTPDEAAVHPQKNVLYRAIGQSSTLEVDTHVRKIQSGDYLLLCSDGLWDLVGEGDIVTLIRGASSPQKACEDLVAAANEAGGPDNITVILWRSPLG
ncbi:MAG: Stp1/IreP family PP2C-type Ser/Thr phosphatase [Anaerolineae bacterium]